MAELEVSIPPAQVGERVTNQLRSQTARAEDFHTQKNSHMADKMKLPPSHTSSLSSVGSRCYKVYGAKPHSSSPVFLMGAKIHIQFWIYLQVIEESLICTYCWGL